MKSSETDLHIWLEDRNGVEATTWAKTESQRARDIFETHPTFRQRLDTIQKIYTSREKILDV
ncbi:MAG: hypothetical protein H7326_00815 [Bdellovibrionaceae bacterium]|nr:hypothetical protein [Pseudobdellovibrionaceae bacterium]